MNNKDADKLVKTAVRTAGMQWGGGPLPRWAHVSRIFCIGNESAIELCHQYGYDPDEKTGYWNDGVED